ncbi:cupin domain-containing protein [Conexibacter sp. JD483]|uniref:cupin domain-containing protein n=1 Tax=unclassified Conexibacter TaxID=2627773 RepID=UPI00271D38A1|nr:MULTISPECIES: cupin domain-containing protein [unclassified Conexibacter]MDO8187673.1 cupin domain-containing protein [Conexibacter sp. CPCC 205706]MDO8199858.1 cupin domain-containing protein [Conexibacter sp. CPCC 205762]MDR9370235.1 cupin domain-containing protein [Conexibacter sp. JD483]
MAKPVVRAYQKDFDALPWAQLAEVSGAAERVIALDDELGSATRFLKLEAGATLPAETLDRWEETYVLEGAFERGGVTYRTGSYICQRPGEERAATSSSDGALLFQLRDFNDVLDKESVAWTAEALEALPWERIPYRDDDFQQKVLSKGPSGSLTALGRIEPGARTTEPDLHDFDEEVLIFDGACSSHRGVYGPGTYTCMPAGAEDGPFVFDSRLTCLEIKNYS